MTRALIASIGLSSILSLPIHACAQSPPLSHLAIPQLIEGDRNQVTLVNSLSPHLSNLPAELAQGGVPDGVLPLDTIEILDITVLRDEIIARLESFPSIARAEVGCGTSETPATEKETLTCIRAFVSNKGVTFENLLAFRSAITQVYIDNGYITSGAFLPSPQSLGNRLVIIQVVEGVVEQIDVSGLRRLREGYVRDRLVKGTAAPLNFERLQKALQLLEQDPLIDRLDAELISGTGTGSNILRLQIEEEDAFEAGVRVSNEQPPSLGSIEGRVFATHANLLGFGDRLGAQYSLTEGLDNFSITYRFPWNSRDGTVSFGYFSDDSSIVEADFEQFDITSDSQTFSLAVIQPLVKTPTREVVLGLTLDVRESQTFLFGEPFSFTLGPNDGESNVTVLRFSQDWVQRYRNQVVALRSQFSVGLDIFDATINETGTDGRFLLGSVNFSGY
ncbi:MAG: ShlB/FhaC/HecB family hemolysin secretion/activation protein [Chloroflexaceae bacterium]|nr:ShlB/FhaC/HecB family hemolysin secretion/activation protein [Chloroflexaceae bacterium]